MNVYEMTRKQLESLPHRKWDEHIECDSLIIIPAKISFLDMLRYKFQLYLSEHFEIFRKPDISEVSGMHDSGFICMDFVAVDENREPICLLGGCSDVIHFDGIGGLGYRWLDRYGTVPNFIPPSGWNIDCLPNSGLLRIFSNRKILCGEALSSFQIYTIDKDEIDVKTEE